MPRIKLEQSVYIQVAHMLGYDDITFIASGWEGCVYSLPNGNILKILPDTFNYTFDEYSLHTLRKYRYNTIQKCSDELTLVVHSVKEIEYIWQMFLVVEMERLYPVTDAERLFSYVEETQGTYDEWFSMGFLYMNRCHPLDFDRWARLLATHTHTRMREFVFDYCRTNILQKKDGTLVFHDCLSWDEHALISDGQ